MRPTNAELVKAHAPQKCITATKPSRRVHTYGVMAPKIYHLHPLVAGPLVDWSRHLARCRSMGFNYVASAHLFRPGRLGDIFLTGDHETLPPAPGTVASAAPAI